VRRSTLTLTFILSLAPGLAQDVHFSKNRYSSIIHTNETDVDLSITDSEISIKSKQVSKSVTTIHIEIPYSSIEAMSFEQVTLRATEPALGIGGLFALIEKAFKSKSYWLEIEYRDGARQATVLRLDESEYQYVIAALEAKTGKHIAILDYKIRPLNPTAERQISYCGKQRYGRGCSVPYGPGYRCSKARHGEPGLQGERGDCHPHRVQARPRAIRVDCAAGWRRDRNWHTGSKG